MSDKMLSPSELIDFLNNWAEMHGEEKLNKAHKTYFRIKSEDRAHAFSSLIKSLRAIGYTREDLESVVLINKIQEYMAPEGATGPRELKAWRQIIRDTWAFEISQDFRKESKFEIVKGREVSATEYIPTKKQEYKEQIEELDTSKLKNPVPTPNFIIEDDLEKLLDEASDE